MTTAREQESIAQNWATYTADPEHHIFIIVTFTCCQAPAESRSSHGGVIDIYLQSEYAILTPVNLKALKLPCRALFRI